VTRLPDWRHQRRSSIYQRWERGRFGIQGGGNQGGGNRRDTRTCFNCGTEGHIARTCPHANGDDEDATATQLLLQGVEDLATEDLHQFAQVDGRLPKA
jgi:hypothetical protein